MKYPIVTTETADGHCNYGLLLEAENSQGIYIQMHGTAGNFYDDDFVGAIAGKIVPEGFSFLSTNNRGSDVWSMYERTGSAVEIFEDCLLDIDVWIQFARDRGYKNIILSGHSLGAEKIVYYLNRGTYRDQISAAVFLAPADSPRWRWYDEQYQPSPEGRERLEAMLREAEEVIRAGRQDELMDTNIRTGFMPRTPVSLLNILGEDTELIKVLPFHTGKLELFRAITIPICVIIGDQREYTGVSPKAALALMSRENPQTETHLVEGADHVFTGFERELSDIVMDFLMRQREIQ